MINNIVVAKIINISTTAYAIKNIKGIECDQPHFRISGMDNSKIEEMMPELILVHIWTEEESQIEEIVVGRIVGIRSEGKYSFLDYDIIKVINSEIKIKDIESALYLNLKNDYEPHSYINIEDVPLLADEIRAMKRKAKNYLYDMSYSPLPFERAMVNGELLSSLAQKNENCIRPFGNHDLARPADSNSDVTPEFQRDYERVVHSKAFRRMVDKAQIFTASKGDHYRSRMTHSLEVAQIAKAIAGKLKLNIQLTEAIALAHDLGHTPFGHQGERALNRKMKDALESRDNPTNHFGGFKHNFQSARVLVELEEKYAEFPGLNVSYQVIEGVLKHTKFRVKNCGDSLCEDCPSCYELASFLPSINLEYVYSDYSHPTTLEGQIVTISDEIAQRSHDLDDALSDGKISKEELFALIALKKLDPIRSRLQEIKESTDEGFDRFGDIEKIKRGRVAAGIIGYFINDVVTSSTEKMKAFNLDNQFFRDAHRFDELLIDFSSEGHTANNYLEKVIRRRVINSTEVVKFDRKSEQIISELFQAFLDNPRLLPHKVLRRMHFRNIEQRCDFSICLSTGCPDIIKEEIRLILTSSDDDYKKKKKILVRTIADFISGMTDSYAISEHQSIFQK